ncbi:MAG: nitrous oxide reductase family maturation protein NosD [Gemmatimonadales bacterium]|nr:MAG: nitrous oxide reductase family maturation protein NosD [Gemmatimonadales bacterium]
MKSPWLLAVIPALLGPGPSRRLEVSPGGALPTIASALEAARDGDTIAVLSGTYREPEIIVRKRVTILGEGGPVLKGGDHQILRIVADSVTVRGLVFEEVSPSAVDDRAAIRVDDARACRIEGNTIHNAFFGIYLAKATGCLIRDNRVTGVGTAELLTGNAIHSWSSSELVIENNELRGYRDGLYFEFTTNAKVRHNTSAGNLRYGIHFMFSNGCSYTGNHFVANRGGSAVMYSRGVTIEDNRFEQSRGASIYGLLGKDLVDSRINGNTFQANTGGLYLEGAIRVEVRGNAFLQNGWGAVVMANAEATHFERNRFEGNSFDVSTNGANATTRFAENYWDRYPGYDLDQDGYGDVPFAPVRLFAFIVQRHDPALILQRSFFVSLLDAAERVAPVLTPRMMEDARPLMTWSGPGGGR